jgi:hypothetical protein
MAANATLAAERKIAGATANVAAEIGLSPYLPADIIGGSVPHVLGAEDEAVWNAASQSCGTDRVHYVYSVADGRVWYLAVPSASMASNPDSWCPLAAALPGNSEYWDRETVYIYDQEGTAAGLRWDQETGRMQVYVGPSRTILPRLQSLDANFVTINLERAQPVIWRNMGLNEEKMSRGAVRFLVWSGGIVALVSLGFWFLTHVAGVALRPNLFKAQAETRAATEKLMLQASQVTRNEADRHIFRLQELLLQLSNINGTLLKYNVKEGKVVWEALVPAAADGSGLDALRAKVMGASPDGRIRIQGNS